MLPINVGDTVNVLISPHQGATTAQVTAIDLWRHQVTVNHLTGALSGRSGVLFPDHVREQNDVQFPRPIGMFWQ